MKTLIAAALLAVSTVASAQNQTIYHNFGDLQRVVSRGLENASHQQQLEFMQAMGYVNAISDFMTVFGNVCVPMGISRGVITNTVFIEARRQGSDPKRPAAEAVAAVLIDLFPCR
jgi:hypothetical protein